MERELIKIRLLCNFNCVIGSGIISYKDEVPDNENAWKGTRRHTPSNIVKIGAPWLVVSDTEEPMWSAYVIIDGKSTKEQCLEHAKSLFELIKKTLADETIDFAKRVEKLEFDRDHISDIFGETDIFS